MWYSRLQAAALLDVSCHVARFLKGDCAEGVLFLGPFIDPYGGRCRTFRRILFFAVENNCGGW